MATAPAPGPPTASLRPRHPLRDSALTLPSPRLKRSEGAGCEGFVPVVRSSDGVEARLVLRRVPRGGAAAAR